MADRSRRLEWTAAGVLTALAGCAAWLGHVSPLVDVPWLIAPAADDVAAPVFTPLQALRTFRVREGFVIERVASEPVVRAPVAMNFDGDGRLWVVEMQGYMPDADATGEGVPASRIVVLEDADQDGEFEKHTVFAEGLRLPRSVAFSYGGVLVLAPPELLWCKDTDGDGKADEKRVLKTGIAGIENPEHAPNTLMFGLDGWWHLSQCDFDFRWWGPQDPRPLETRRTPVHGQWGMTRDDLGRFYYTPNSTPLLMDVVPKFLTVQDGKSGSLPSVGLVVGGDGTTWPIRPTPGVNRGYLADVLRPDKTLASVTAACGLVMNRSDGLGEAYRNDVFICEPAGNLVKHLDVAWGVNIPKVTNPAGMGEFVASTDERFRPVWATVGPDGFLYIADMYRGVIQHKTYLTPYLREQVERRALEAPLECGRIWRIRPEGAAVATTMERLSSLDTAGLVRTMMRADGPVSDEAFRMVLEGRDSLAADLVREHLGTMTEPIARMRLVSALDGLGAMTDAERAALHGDADVLMRRLGAGSERDLERLRAEPDVWVRVLAALQHGGKGDERGAHLAACAEGVAANSHLTAAVVLASRGVEVSTLRAMAQRPEGAALKAVMKALAVQVFRAGSPVERAAMLEIDVSGGTERLRKVLVDACMTVQFGDPANPRRVSLAFAAPAWLQGLRGGKAIGDYLDWPGKPRVVEVPKPAPLTAAEERRIAEGAVLFSHNCASCHLATGEGAPGQVAPLRGSPTVVGDARVLARVLIHGLEGEMMADGVTYKGSMPAAVSLDDAKIAAVMSYIRTNFGNEAGPVEPSLVNAERVAGKDRNRPMTTSEIGRSSPQESPK